MRKTVKVVLVFALIVIVIGVVVTVVLLTNEPTNDGNDPTNEPTNDGNDPVDCEGEWVGACEPPDCSQTYKITTPAANGGEKCDHYDNYTTECENSACTDAEDKNCSGEWVGDCQYPICTQTYEVIVQAVGTGTLCDSETGDTRDCTSSCKAPTDPTYDGPGGTDGVVKMGDAGTTCDALGQEFVQVRGGISCEEAISHIENSLCSGAVQSVELSDLGSNIDVPEQGGPGCYCNTDDNKWYNVSNDNSAFVWAEEPGRQPVCISVVREDTLPDTECEYVGVAVTGENTPPQRDRFKWPYTGVNDNGCSLVTNRGIDGFPDYTGTRAYVQNMWAPTQFGVTSSSFEGALCSLESGKCKSSKANKFSSHFPCPKRPTPSDDLKKGSNTNVIWQDQRFLTRRQVLQKALGWFVFDFPMGSCKDKVVEGCADPDSAEYSLWPDNKHKTCPYFSFDNPDCCALPAMAYSMGVGCGSTGNGIPFELAQPGDIWQYGIGGGHHVGLFRMWEKKSNRLFFDQYDPTKENFGLTTATKPMPGDTYIVWQLGGGGACINAATLTWLGNSSKTYPLPGQINDYGAGTENGGFGPLDHWSWGDQNDDEKTPEFKDKNIQHFIYRYGRLILENGCKEPYKGLTGYSKSNMDTQNGTFGDWVWNNPELYDGTACVAIRV